MIITTKFKAGQKVYLLYKNNVLHVEIKETRVYITKAVMIINYTIESKEITQSFQRVFAENELFATKKELLNSL